MKRFTQILYIATVSTLIGCASNYPPKEKHKECHTVVFRIENGSKIKENESKIVRKYNDQGEEIKTLYYDEDLNKLSRYTEYQIDCESNITTSTTYDAEGIKQFSTISPNGDHSPWLKNYGPDGTLVGVIKLKFDDQDRKTEALYLKGDGSILHKLVYEYDDKENTKTRITYDAEGQQEPGKIVGKYDENQDLVRQDWYDSPDRIFQTYDYTYSDGKRQTRTRSAAGKIFELEKYKHDRKGKTKETYTYEPDQESGELKLTEIRITTYKY